MYFKVRNINGLIMISHFGFHYFHFAAKDESCGNGSMLEKPDIENIGEDSAKSDNLLDKEIVDSNKLSNDIQVRSNCGSSRFNNARNFEKEHDAHKSLCCCVLGAENLLYAQPVLSGC